MMPVLCLVFQLIAPWLSGELIKYDIGNSFLHEFALYVEHSLLKIRN